ncbi:fumarate hydratase [Rhodoplanes elegans]|uniref:Fumarate hydratase n=1 Tax=Rhodoplanes elegans TaxID=29408 RepID=A0A327KE48_9BRAD|nr:fumarate hydratase C-terminal domain-containing protein [Rhodoplanes elegans]MBK5958986.1 fumarate hydratase [Rhodoplanes elegans]RAI35923.1 fumarate hydratase [Rhodoplanes elegans]
MAASLDLPRLKLPLSRAEARALALGDVVLLDGEAIVTIGMPTHQRMMTHIAEGKPLPFDLTGQAFFHLSICSRETEDAVEPLYVNPTTSSRFNAYLPTLIRTYGLCATSGKGGLDMACAKAMQEVGCVYFSMIGGASALLSEGVAEVIETAWDDLIMQFRLTRVRLDGFGPLTVAIDAHGNSLYADLSQTAKERLPGILDRLKAGRARA